MLNCKYAKIEHMKYLSKWFLLTLLTMSFLCNYKQYKDYQNIWNETDAKLSFIKLQCRMLLQGGEKNE